MSNLLDVTVDQNPNRIVADRKIELPRTAGGYLFWKPFNPKLMIVGHGRHGKDSVAEIIQRLYGFKFTSSSWFCAGKVMMPLFAELLRPYPSVEACFNDRHRGDNREVWFNAISEYCSKSPGKLTAEIFAENDLYCGIRSKREFWTSRNRNLFDHSIWVERWGTPLESALSMQIEPWMCDYHLMNDGSLEDLEARVIELMSTILRKWWKTDVNHGNGPLNPANSYGQTPPPAAR